MRNPKKIKLSLIVPVYNEEKRIHNLEEIISYAKKDGLIHEIIVVNDGSTDRTNKLLKDIANTYPLTIVSYKKNRGKGHAIKKGVLSAKGTHVVFIDIDLSTPISTIKPLVKIIPQFDIVIGTRKNKEARLKERQPLLRELMGKSFTFLSQTLLKVYVTDFTCGFKCFAKKAAFKIFSLQKIERWSFDAEALFLAKKLNFSIGELPVVWKNDPNTKVKFPQDILISIYELLTIINNERKGAYKKLLNGAQ